MTYSVKEIFYTLQGEGGQAGMPAVFCRFAGCNLWTGREQDRPKAICQFCDTDFVGTDGTLGGKFATADELAERILGQWPADDSRHRMVVLTGGEPLLQVDQALIAALHVRGFRISVESNGTVAAPEGIDWLCISPKAGADWIQRSGQELKLVWPQPTFDLAAIEASTEFQHYFLQPMDNARQSSNIAACIAQCMQRPGWRLSLQTHKLTGIR
ncbi:7-carboxy-7-deazaguanine synthase [Comamonas thiooxydans]|uniref:7-carboxy-7-deazaguanine synthase n=1 Tax=Comamonas thiooxydans TaxID=363952 RepID=UPI001E3C564C|nr:7-carboxy-7-deazaguanine synthase [Comamonas thiooxydans]BDB71601.1 7-carboxy-7-deazaguanine synthase [Comamonas thiooxydans]